jgi:phosphoglycolate phosphatase
VGDNLHDLEMGRAAGAGLVVGVLTGTSEHGDLAPFADRVLESIVELEALLDEIAAT